VRWTPAQSGIAAAGRAGNLRGAFTVRGPCANLRVAVVDDVLTTGATAGAMAGALARAGASHIEVWCLARTPAPGA
jgi:predicted amidophosphoribosyltransferase